MPFRYFLVLFLLFTAHLAGAQDLKMIGSEIREIDSLLAYNRFETVERKSDSLYLIIQGSTFTEQKLKLRMLKGIGMQGLNQNQQALPILLDVISEAEEKGFHKITCQSAIYISLIHEINGDFINAYKYIIQAKNLSEKFRLEAFYSTIMVRMASIHRILGRSDTRYEAEKAALKQLGFTASRDSTMSLAMRALGYAQKFNNARDEHDCYFLIGACYSYLDDYRKAVEYGLKELPYYKKVEDATGIFYAYLNISDNLFDVQDYSQSLVYNDSVLRYYHRINEFEKYVVFERRAKIFEGLNQLDSAYHYMQLAYRESRSNDGVQVQTEIRKLEEQYQNDKKEQTIQSRNLQLILTLSLLGVIMIASVVFVRKNREINRQNKIINRQVAELQKTVEQKEILLSELQHRVKNNLQYVISLLEIQKESIGHSSIEDLIRNNQNRIHSIALLHKKLNVDESVHDVELKRYVTELSELVLESYKINDKKVNLFISCNVHTLPLTKAMPVGLIIVELLSNSLKHAFSDIDEGKITIDISYDNERESNKLHYQDNGSGFDFENVKTKGLGIEITKGLIDQLDARIETNRATGFDLTIYFN